MNYLKYYAKKVGPIILLLLYLHLLDPFGRATQLGYLLVFVVLFFKKKVFYKLLDHEVLWLFLFSATYTLFNALGPNKGVQYLIIQLVFPSVFYLLGKYLVIPGMTKRQLVLLLVSFGFAFSITSLLSVGTNLLNDGFVVADRNLPNFWTGKQLLATGLAAFLIYNLLLPGIILTNKKQFKPITIIVLTGIYIITLLCAFRLGSRLAIAITGIGLLVGFLQVLASQSVVSNIKFLFGSVILIALMIRFVPFDLNAEYLSVLGDRLQDSNASSISTAGNRTQLWQKGLQNLFKYPLGYHSEHYAHNVWLDVARVAGIIPLIFLLINNFTVLRNLKRIFSLKAESIGITTIFVLYFLAIFLIFFSEPILEGTFYAVTLYCLFQGILKSYIIQLYNERSYQTTEK